MKHKTKILVIEPAKKSETKKKLRFSLHLCPDAEDLSYDYGGGKRSRTYWDRVHINTPWFHFMFAINPRGRFTRLVKLPDGTWSKDEKIYEWAVFSRWKYK